MYPISSSVLSSWFSFSQIVCVYLFQQLPVVPLFGDMQISLISYVKKCPHFEAARWSCASENAEEKIGMTQYNLTGKIDLIQDEHVKFMCELSRANNEVRVQFLLLVILVVL